MLQHTLLLQINKSKEVHPRLKLQAVRRTTYVRYAWKKPLIALYCGMSNLILRYFKLVAVDICAFVLGAQDNLNSVAFAGNQLLKS